MESRRYIDPPHTGANLRAKAVANAGLGRTAWLLAVGLFLGVVLMAAAIWLRGRGLDLQEEELGVSVASADLTPQGDGAAALTPLAPRDLQRQEDREVPTADASSVPIEDGVFDEGQIWTIQFVPLHPDGLALSGIEAQLMTHRAVTSHWRGYVPIGQDGAVRLEVSGPAAVILNADLWVGTDPGALAALDGRILRGEPGMRAGARFDLGARVDLVASASVDTHARIYDLGRVTLQSPARLGEVSLLGQWASSVNVLVTAYTGGSACGVLGECRRRFDLQGADRALVVSAYLKGENVFDESWSASAWTDKNEVRASDRAQIGTSIGLQSPTRRGLDLSVDIAALPKAARIVIPMAESTHAAVLDKETYQALIVAARWTAVVPQSIVNAGKVRYDLGYVSLQDGPAGIEVWSVRNEEGLRTLLFQTSVNVQGDVLPVLLR